MRAPLLCSSARVAINFHDEHMYRLGPPNSLKTGSSLLDASRPRQIDRRGNFAKTVCAGVNVLSSPSIPRTLLASHGIGSIREMHISIGRSYARIRFGKNDDENLT